MKACYSHTGKITLLTRMHPSDVSQPEWHSTRSAIEGVPVGTTATLAMTGTSTGRSTRNPQLRAYLLIVLVAVVAWGAVFLTPESRYWDDWVFNYDTIEAAREVGVPWVGYTFVALGAIGIWSFKIVALGATIIVGCTTYEISGRGLGLKPRERLLLALLVTALPLNATRMMVVLDYYCWSLALFFVAWYLLVSKNPSDAGRVRYIIATVFLFASFSTGSLLPFAALPVAHLAYLAIRRDVPWWEGLLRFIARFWYLLLAPVVYWTIRTVFLQPYGLYQGYNKVGLNGGTSNRLTVDALGLLVVMVFVALIFVLWLLAGHSTHTRIWRKLSLGALAVTTGALGYFLLRNRVSIATTALAIPVAILLCAAILLVVAALPIGFDHKSRDDTGIESGNDDVTPVLAVGLIALAIALIPYLLVGKLPSFAQWATRHQLLMPLGVAIIIVATFRALAGIFPLPVLRLFTLGLVTVFAFLSLAVSLKLVADWRKQAQVIAALAKEPLARKASIVVFSDRTVKWNYESRAITFYEYSGWLTQAFGNQERLGIDQTSVPGFLNGSFRRFVDSSSRYGFDEYKKPTNPVLVQIVPITGASWWTLLANEPSVKLRVTPIKSWTRLSGRS